MSIPRRLVRYSRQMRPPTTHRDVIAWQEAMAVLAAVYRDTAGFPAEEMFALTARIRRTALALPARLADGATRDTIEALLHCLDMSCGSVAALDTQLKIAVRLGYLEPNAGAVIRTRRLGMLMSVLRQWLRDEAIRQPQVGAFQRSKAKRGERSLTPRSTPLTGQ